LLKELGKRGVVEVVSLEAEETVVRVGQEHWSCSSLPPAAASGGKRLPTIANLKEVLLRLSGVRVGVAEVEELKRMAEVDAQELMDILDSFLRRGFSYGSLDWVTGAVLDEVNRKRYPWAHR
jgi:hypothetical protein